MSKINELLNSLIEGTSVETEKDLKQLPSNGVKSGVLVNGTKFMLGILKVIEKYDPNTPSYVYCYFTADKKSYSTNPHTGGEAGIGIDFQLLDDNKYTIREFVSWV